METSNRTSSDRRARELINEATRARDEGRNPEAFDLLRSARSLAESDATKSKCHNMLSLLLKREGRFDEAFEENERAREYVTDPYLLAILDNNSGSLKIEWGRPEEAHAYIEKAKRVFATLYAQVLETEARALLAEERTTEALQAIAESIRLLATAENDRARSESLSTLLALLEKDEKSDFDGGAG